MIYLASPYSHPDLNIMHQRYVQTMKHTAKLLFQGKHVFSPIVHCHELARWFNLPTEYNFWLEYNQHMLARADELLVLCLEGWSESKGVAGEIEFARVLNIPVEYLDA